jgi:hypothetical protein
VLSTERIREVWTWAGNKDTGTKLNLLCENDHACLGLQTAEDDTTESTKCAKSTKGRGREVTNSDTAQWRLYLYSMGSSSQIGATKPSDTPARKQKRRSAEAGKWI